MVKMETFTYAVLLLATVLCFKHVNGYYPLVHCGPNEEYKRCSTVRKPSCEDPNPLMQPMPCVPGCDCLPGYYKNNIGVCVLPGECYHQYPSSVPSWVPGYQRPYPDWVPGYPNPYPDWVPGYPNPNLDMGINYPHVPGYAQAL